MQGQTSQHRSTDLMISGKNGGGHEVVQAPDAGTDGIPKTRLNAAAASLSETGSAEASCAPVGGSPEGGGMEMVSRWLPSTSRYSVGGSSCPLAFGAGARMGRISKNPCPSCGLAALMADSPRGFSAQAGDAAVAWRSSLGAVAIFCADPAMI